MICKEVMDEKRGAKTNFSWMAGNKVADAKKSVLPKQISQVAVNPIKKSGEKVLKSLRQSRKSFFIEYLCGFSLLLLILLVSGKGVAIPSSLLFVTVGLAVFSVGSAEFKRFSTRYRIMPSKISIVKGIIKQSKKNIHFHPLGFVPDINVKQGRIQRLLNYGSVFVAGEEKHAFEIKNITSPGKILAMIEDLVEENRTVHKTDEDGSGHLSSMNR